MLLLRRSETDIRRPLQWDFPGGLLDDGETLEGGVVREIKEETNLDVDNVALIFGKTEVSDWTDEGGAHEVNTIRLYYTAKADSTDVKLSFEHSEFIWLELEKALEQLEYHRHKEVLKYILNNHIM